MADYLKSRCNAQPAIIAIAIQSRIASINPNLNPRWCLHPSARLMSSFSISSSTLTTQGTEVFELFDRVSFLTALARRLEPLQLGEQVHPTAAPPSLPTPPRFLAELIQAQRAVPRNCSVADQADIHWSLKCFLVPCLLTPRTDSHSVATPLLCILCMQFLHIAIYAKAMPGVCWPLSS